MFAGNDVEHGEGKRNDAGGDENYVKHRKAPSSTDTRKIATSAYKIETGTRDVA